MNSKPYLKARAPAKLILSGEHAVLYGQPALAMAINRYTETTVSWSTPLHLSFDLLGINYKQKLTLEALKRLKHKLQRQYQAFHHGRLSIREVLKNPFELTLYTAMNVLERLKHALPMGIDIGTDSSIPIGAGLGSSAACVVSMIKALCHFLAIDLSVDDYLRLGIESENLQHGVSSGLDIRMSYHGGAGYFHQGHFHTRPLPNLPLQLVLTGCPSSTTGECVAHAAKFFQDPGLAAAFGTVTHALDQALLQHQTAEVADLINQNQLLLQRLQVVPSKVTAFINEVRTWGAAAKVCGAGSVQGDAAGAVLVLGDIDLRDLCQRYAYQIMPITGDAHGAVLLP